MMNKNYYALLFQCKENEARVRGRSKITFALGWGGEGFQKANTREQIVFKYSDKCERYGGGVQKGSKTANVLFERPLI